MGSLKFHEISLYFTVCAVFVLVSWVSLIRCLRRRRDARETGEATGKKPGDGWLVLHEWGPTARGFVAASILVFVFVPTMIFVVAFLFAAMLAPAEEWTYSDTFDYILCNMIGVGPLVDLMPDTTFGMFVDIVVSLWGLLVTATLLGLAACVNLSTTMSSNVPEGVGGLMRTMLIYIPLCLIAVASVSGLMLAAIEKWPPGDGILFMIGELCGIEDPLTESSPETTAAAFFTTLCFAVELSIGGAIIGTVGAHSSVIAFLVCCEGEAATTESEDEKAGLDKSSLDKESALQRIQELEDALKLQREESSLKQSELEEKCAKLESQLSAKNALASLDVPGQVET
jgi:hypothetical protein